MPGTVLPLSLILRAIEWGRYEHPETEKIKKITQDISGGVRN